MKWIGQHIWDFTSRFRNDVYLETLTENFDEFTVVIGNDNKLYKSTTPSEKSKIQVRNDEGSTIPAGAPLYSKGEIGGSDRIKVGICVSSDPAKMPCIGIAEFEMNTTSTKDSFAITQGVYNTNIHGFTGLAEGDILYVNGGVAPHLTPTKPTNGDLIQNVGIVLKTNGTICQGLLVSAIGRTNDVPWPLYVDHTTQRVGIGTSSPTVPFHVIGDARIQGNLTVNGTYTQIDTDVNTTEQWLVTNDGTGPAAVINQLGTEDIFDVQDDGTSVFYIEDGGNIGVGTTDPVNILHIRDSASSDGTTVSIDNTYGESPKTLQFLYNGSVPVAKLIGYGRYSTSHNPYFAIEVNDTTTSASTNTVERLRITSAGDVGIGTTTPHNKAHITSSGNQDGLLLDLSTGSSGDYTGVYFKVDNNTTNAYKKGGLVWERTGSYNEGRFHFLLNNEDNTNNVDLTDSKFTILSTGNVGIGTTSPSEKLHVNGGVLIESTNPALFFTDTNSDSDYSIKVNGGVLNVRDETNDAARISLKSNGNVGIGTTSPSKKLEVVDTSENIQLVLKGATNANSGIRFTDGVDADSATIYYYHVDKRLRFFVDNAEALNIISGGNVGIGTASPDHKFHVEFTNGDTSFSGGGLGNWGSDGIRIENTSGTVDTMAMLQFRNADADIHIAGIRQGTNDSGNVGIGTTSPSEKLHILGDLKVQTNVDAGVIHFGDTSDQTKIVGYDGSYGSPRIDFFTDNSTKRATIGTQLTVYGNIKIEDNDTLQIGDANDLQIYHNGTDSVIDNIAGDFYISQKAADKDLIFRADDGAGGFETYFFLDGSGNSGNNPRTVFPDNSSIVVGTGNDLFIKHTGTNSEIFNFTGDLIIGNHGNDKDIIFQCDDGSGGVTEYFKLDGSSAAHDGSSYTALYTTFPDNSLAAFGDSQDLVMYHSGTNSFIRHLGDGHLYIDNTTDDANIYFRSDDGSGGLATYFRLNGSSAETVVSKDMRWEDSVKAKFGAGSDLQIYHDGTNSFIVDAGTGDLLNYFSNEWKVIKYGSSETCIEATSDGSVDLYYDNNKKFETTSTGVDITGNIAADTFVSIQGVDTGNPSAGTDELRVSGYGILGNRSSGVYITNENSSGKLFFGVGDKHALATKMTILSSGNVGIGTTSPSSKLQVDGNVKLNDTYRLKIGDSDDLQIYHDGSHSYIKENGQGNLRIDASNFYVRNSGGTKIAIDALDSAEVALRYDGSRKLETTSTGVEVTGNINVSGSVQRQISTTHHTFTFGAAGSAAQDYWVPFIGNSELAAPNVTHRTIAPYGGILKKAIVHSTVAYGSSAQVRFHRINNGATKVFANDNSTDDVTTNVTADMSTAYTGTSFNFTTGNTFSAGDQIGVSFVRDNTGLGDVAITLVWEYELF
jgi:hypothetical protein